MSVPVQPLFSCDARPQLAEYEAKLKVSLPTSYRSFLERYNGVVFTEYPYPRIKLLNEDPIDGDGELTLLYGLSDVPHLNDLRTAGLGLEFNQRVPDHIIAIGSTPYHERIALSIRGEDAGSVYLWRPGEPWEPGPNKPTMQYLHLVAKDFAGFWQQIAESHAE
jgi:hypothetical protein